MQVIECPECGAGSDVQIAADGQVAGRWAAACGLCAHRWSFED